MASRGGAIGKPLRRVRYATQRLAVAGIGDGKVCPAEGAGHTSALGDPLCDPRNLGILPGA